MAVPTIAAPDRPDADTAPAGALTDKGRAVVALLRFSDLFAALEPGDRAYFADELAQLAWEALGKV